MAEDNEALRVFTEAQLALLREKYERLEWPAAQRRARLDPPTRRHPVADASVLKIEIPAAIVARLAALKRAVEARGEGVGPQPLEVMPPDESRRAPVTPPSPAPTPEPSAVAVQRGAGVVQETLVRMGYLPAMREAFGATHFDATILMAARNILAYAVDARPAAQREEA